MASIAIKGTRVYDCNKTGKLSELIFLLLFSLGGGGGGGGVRFFKGHNLRKVLFPIVLQ
jgi:hypothetical protein